MQPLPPPPGRRPDAVSSSRPDTSPGQTQPPISRPRPTPNPVAPQQAATNATEASSGTTVPPKKRKHRGGKKRRNRRKSFAAPPSEASGVASNMDLLQDEDEHESEALRPGESFYKRKHNRSNESIDSDALLDHRHHQPMRPRRESRLNVLAVQRAGFSTSLGRQNSSERRHHTRRRTGERSRQSDDDELEDETTPLMTLPMGHRSPAPDAGYGLFRSNTRASSSSSAARKRTRSNQGFLQPTGFGQSPGYNVNNPPSVPGSPHLQATLEDPMMPETGSFLNRSPDSTRNLRSRTMGDVLIDIDRQDALDGDPHSAPPSPRLNPDGLRHKRAMTFGGEDVCMPDAMSEIAEDDFDRVGSRDEITYSQRRRRRKEWPKLWVFEEWSREEKELRAADTRRTQRIQEPLYVDGMLRAPRRSAWHREEAPNRFTYFNVELESTIHAPTISELVPPEGDFRELFIPEPPVLEDSSSSESEPELEPEKTGTKSTSILSPKIAPATDETTNNLSRLSTNLASHRRSRSQDPTRLDAILSDKLEHQSRSVSRKRSHQGSGEHTPQRSPQPNTHTAKDKPRRYGKRPQFWLDVLCPTPQEMQVMKVAFGIHPLTAEDILQQEAREKVELFRNYYFINYRTFEQDQGSEDFLEPINVYILVFAHGILTFHFSQIPHPANVRRRIRQLQDYLDLSADWISYAIIDDITDVFGPMITNIEQEVDEVDEAVLQSTPGAFSVDKDATGDKELKDNEKTKNDKESSDSSSLFSLPNFLKDGGQKKKDTSGYDMLRRLGESRKKVMSLYRLLSTKADVIKGFAKRCNDQLDLKNEIGLYLGDIQDHILTMTSSLSHYEALLGRAHSNYLAQVSIRMNERSEQTGDILNKLTVFGTIVLPMNIICGMWGMNVKVPGQDVDNLWWFSGITAGLIAFAVGCYLLCKKLYGIV